MNLVQFALRRPPTGHVLATAHDMAREHRILSALAGSSVAVPVVIRTVRYADRLGEALIARGADD